MAPPAPPSWGGIAVVRWAASYCSAPPPKQQLPPVLGGRGGHPLLPLFRHRAMPTSRGGSDDGKERAPMQPTRSPRIVYCGMFGSLSHVPLAALFDAGFDVRAVVVPAAAELAR